MNLLIDIRFPYDFVKSIMRKLKREVLIQLLLNDFTKIDIEMNELFQFPEVVLSKEVILYALDNLIIVKRSNYYSIEINPIINYPKTKIKLITLVRFISFGNSSVHGNSILTDEIKKLNKDLYLLYEIYKLKGVAY